KMQLQAYSRLSTCSRRAIRRQKTHFGKTYQYTPRGRLLVRLSRELGMTKEAVYQQLMRESLPTQTAKMSEK
ncbi:MAG: hypothetical protein ACKPCM_00795, partial [Pseudanabaena sp.]